MTQPNTRPLTYADAGVNISAANEIKKGIGRLVTNTYTQNVVGGFGHFGGLFNVSFLKSYDEPVLVSSVDGVGTKLKIAFETGIHNTVGRDIVNHCINDILVMGARPLFFLDYIASGLLIPEVTLAVVQGMSEACEDAEVVLIGGETAQMPDFYAKGEYDIAGTIVGVVDKKKIIDGRQIAPGDVIIGLRSNGLHTNGYSLARKIVIEVAHKRYSDPFEPTGKTFGQELLKPHRSYAPLLNSMSRGIIKGCAHITGGGFTENVNRVLPPGVNAVIEAKRWEPDPIFRFLQNAGGVELTEMYRTFNMGVGMVVVVDAAQGDTILRAPDLKEFAPLVVGRIVDGSGSVKMEF